MKRKTRSGKAGLRFPVARIHHLLKRSTCSMRISAHAPVYLGAVLEYLTAEILETAGVVARQCHHPKITPRHIQIGAKGDEEMGQLLSDVILSEGGVLPEPYRAHLYPQPERKDAKKKKIYKKRSQDTSRIHIGGSNSLRANKKEQFKRKRSLSCGDDVDTLSKRAHVRENNGISGNGASFEDDRHGIGLAFRRKRKASDKTNSVEGMSTGPKNSLFQGCEEMFGPFNSNSFNLSKCDQTLETSWELPNRNRGNFNASLFSNTSTLQTYGDESLNQSFQSFRELFQDYDESFRGSNKSFQGPLERSFSSQHDGRCMRHSNVSVSSTNKGFTSPFNYFSHQKPPQDIQNGTFQSRSSFESLNPQNFNDSVMNFEDFILERSNIPSDLLEMSLQGAAPKNLEVEDVVLRKINNLNNNLSKDEVSKRRNIPEIPSNEEIAKRNNNLEILKKNLTLKDWKTLKKKDETVTSNIFENEPQKKVLRNNSQTNNESVSPEKIEVESSTSPKSENIASQLISDFQIYSESDCSETLHVDESIDKDDNVTESILQSTPIKNNNEVNIENVIEKNDTKNAESCLQDCVVSSSLGLPGSNSSSSNSPSAASPIKKPCPDSKRKHNAGDLVWARFKDSSFYPAIVINDPHYKFYTKIVEASRSQDSTEGGENRLYHLQFLYSSSRRAWIPSSRIIRYEGITRYEERVKKDVENMSVYRPRNSNLKLQWREAVLTAKRLESLGKLERIGKCEDARCKYLDDEKYSLKETGTYGNRSKDKGKDEVNQKKVLAPMKNSSVQRKDLEQKELGPSGANLFKRSNRNHKHISPEGESRFRSKVGSSKFSKAASNENMQQSIVQIKIEPVHKIVELKEMDCLRKVREEFEMGKISSTNNVELKTNRISSSFQKTKEIDKSSLKEDNPISEVETIEDVNMMTKMTKVVATITEDDKFARPGDLVWGRMRGFPHWPGFVTKSPQGVYKKEGKHGGNTNYHVQFFNWNDESGWVNSIVKFYGLEHFKKTKTWSAMKLRSLEHKWYKAACDAEQTIGLSRKERLNEYLVPY